MPVHPQHDLVASLVRSWYTDWPGRAPGPASSEADIGVTSHRESFGYLRDGPGPWDRRVILTVDEPSDVAAALEAAAEFYDNEAFDVWVDDRARAVGLHGALERAGFEAPDNTIVLALVGPLRAAAEPPGLEVEEVADEDRLRIWARVRLMGFADSEEKPEAAAVEEQLQARIAEWAISRCQLARLHGAPAGILAHYTGPIDQMVFLLATRVPFRNLGIAQSMLRRWTQRATSEGARSLLINCDEHGRPAVLYRRMGFVDEVYWHRRYRRRPPSEP